ncbi:MAG: hypothetical protein U9Q77_01400 [Candidatus Marinimicrobia bacterium]|nr:hypothetical protein [Candidatus Neomarinimicrobiota bacterium]
MDRLQPGMELDGRIVEVLGNHIYILRIWGNNILTESNHTFNKLDEVVLSVRAVKPKLVFNLRPIATGNSKGSIYA